LTVFPLKKTLKHSKRSLSVPCLCVFVMNENETHHEEAEYMFWKNLFNDSLHKALLKKSKLTENCPKFSYN